MRATCRRRWPIRSCADGAPPDESPVPTPPSDRCRRSRIYGRCRSVDGPSSTMPSDAGCIDHPRLRSEPPPGNVTKTESWASPGTLIRAPAALRPKGVRERDSATERSVCQKQKRSYLRWAPARVLTSRCVGFPPPPDNRPTQPLSTSFRSIVPQGPMSNYVRPSGATGTRRPGRTGRLWHRSPRVLSLITGSLPRRPA
jgi:hypothetical protein